jgi:hypothetical protein
MGDLGPIGPVSLGAEHAFDLGCAPVEAPADGALIGPLPQRSQQTDLAEGRFRDAQHRIPLLGGLEGDSPLGAANALFKFIAPCLSAYRSSKRFRRLAR